jgi:hypothetical protein
MKTSTAFRWSLTLGVLAIALTPGLAQAQEGGRGVITLAEVSITGRVQKPIAAVDVSRIQPIEKAIYREPF